MYGYEVLGCEVWGNSITEMKCNGLESWAVEFLGMGCMDMKLWGVKFRLWKRGTPFLVIFHLSTKAIGKAVDHVAAFQQGLIRKVTKKLGDLSELLNKTIPIVM